MFETIRVAVNGDKNAAREWFERMDAIARGEDPEEKPKTVVASAEEFKALFG